MKFKCFPKLRSFPTLKTMKNRVARSRFHFKMQTLSHLILKNGKRLHVFFFSDFRGSAAKMVLAVQWLNPTIYFLRKLPNGLCWFCNPSLSKSNIFHVTFKGASSILQPLSIKIKKNNLGLKPTSTVFATPLYQIQIIFQVTLVSNAQNHEKQTCAKPFSLRIANTIALDLKNWQTAGWTFL